MADVDPKVMSLFEHLDELRGRLVWSILAFFVLFFGSMGFASPIINFLKKPLQDALPGVEHVLHFTGPADVMFASINVAMLSGLVLAAPVWLYHFWRFIEPALYETERRFIFPFIALSVALFGAGVSFCFYVVLPMTLGFLLSLGAEVGEAMITVNDYLSMLFLLLFGFGVIFELPLMLILLARLGLIDAAMLRQVRRYVIVGNFIVAALLTPPDPLSQIAMAIPLCVLYEGSILVIGFMEKPKPSLPVPLD